MELNVSNLVNVEVSKVANEKTLTYDMGKGYYVDIRIVQNSAPTDYNGHFEASFYKKDGYKMNPFYCRTFTEVIAKNNGNTTSLFEVFRFEAERYLNRSGFILDYFSNRFIKPNLADIVFAAIPETQK